MDKPAEHAVHLAEDIYEGAIHANTGIPALMMSPSFQVLSFLYFNEWLPIGEHFLWQGRLIGQHAWQELCGHWSYEWSDHVTREQPSSLGDQRLLLIANRSSPIPGIFCQDPTNPGAIRLHEKGFLMVHHLMNLLLQRSNEFLLDTYKPLLQASLARVATEPRKPLPPNPY